MPIVGPEFVFGWLTLGSRQLDCCVIPSAGAGPARRLEPADKRRARGPDRVAIEQERLAAALRNRLADEAHSVPDLCLRPCVGDRELMAKLNGEVALGSEELATEQWSLGIPQAETALSNFSQSYAPSAETT